MQSFTLWQQATIEIMRCNLSSCTLVIMFNRSHVDIGRATTSQSLLLLLAHATYIMVLFFTHIPFVVNHTINATPPERLQHYFTGDILAATDRVELLCCQLKIWSRGMTQYSTKKKVTLSGKCHTARGVTVMCYGCYANEWFSVRLSPCQLLFFFSLRFFRLCLGVTFRG